MEEDLQKIFDKHFNTLFLTRGPPRDVRFSVTFIDNLYAPIQMRLIEPYIEKIIEGSSAEVMYDIVHCEITKKRTLTIGFSGHTVHTEYLKRNFYPSMGLRH